MIIVSIREIKSFTDFHKRLKKIKKKTGNLPDFIIMETKKVFNDFHKLSTSKPMTKKASYQLSFEGIELILPWQTRI